MTDDKQYVENPVVQLAYINIKKAQETMRVRLDAGNDICNLLSAIPEDILKEDQENLKNLMEKMIADRKEVFKFNNFPTWYKESHKNEDRAKKFAPTRDSYYNAIIKIVVNRLQKAYGSATMNSGGI